MNQCWLTIIGVLLHSPKTNFTGSPRGLWVKQAICTDDGDCDQRPQEMSRFGTCGTKSCCGFSAQGCGVFNILFIEETYTCPLAFKQTYIEDKQTKRLLQRAAKLREHLKNSAYSFYMVIFSALLAVCAGNSPVNSPHKGQWRGVLMFSLICAWTIGWVNNHEAGDLRRQRAHYDVIVMMSVFLTWGFVRYRFKATTLAACILGTNLSSRYWDASYQLPLCGWTSLK